MKKILKNTLYIYLFLVIFSSCRNVNENENDYVIKTIKVELVNGHTKIVKYKIHSYATIGIYESRGGYRMSTWKYCFGGMARCEVLLMNGVVYCEVLN